MYSLRERIEDSKADYQKRYGALDWEWTDEGLPWTIQNYHESVGSVVDFTPDDWQVCKESGWVLDDVCILCGEPWFCQNTDGLCSYLNMVLEDWRQRKGMWGCPDIEVSRTAVLAAVEDFYVWRKEILPMAQQIYAEA